MIKTGESEHQAVNRCPCGQPMRGGAYRQQVWNCGLVTNLWCLSLILRPSRQKCSQVILRLNSSLGLYILGVSMERQG